MSGCWVACIYEHDSPKGEVTDATEPISDVDHLVLLLRKRLTERPSGPRDVRHRLSGKV